MGCIINSDLWECDLCGFIEIWDDFDDIHEIGRASCRERV